MFNTEARTWDRISRGPLTHTKRGCWEYRADPALTTKSNSALPKKQHGFFCHPQRWGGNFPLGVSYTFAHMTPLRFDAWLVRPAPRKVRLLQPPGEVQGTPEPPKSEGFKKFKARKQISLSWLPVKFVDTGRSSRRSRQYITGINMHNASATKLTLKGCLHLLKPFHLRLTDGYAYGTRLKGS